ncbi:chemotaxis protein CheW [Photobacterium sp. CCB-ST2H9]|uniref:chemotaxis protein CheW n=1 Tax=Photobacterium sp. CCB-ST2H9 TaxID=2912855 RepID=UPI003531D808
MNDNFKLSSEQALDDYFFGLLDDSQQPDDVLTDPDSAELAAPAHQESEDATPDDAPQMVSELATEPVHEEPQEELQAELQEEEPVEVLADMAAQTAVHQPFDFNLLDESADSEGSLTAVGAEPPSLRAMATPIPSPVPASSLSGIADEEPELRVPEVRFTPPRSKADLDQLQRLLDQMSAMQAQVISESEAWVADQHQLAALELQDDAEPVETGLNAPGWFEDSEMLQESAQEAFQTSITETVEDIFPEPLPEPASLIFQEPEPAIAPYAEPEDDFWLMQTLPKVAEAPSVTEPEVSRPVMETSSQPEEEIVVTSAETDILNDVAVEELSVPEETQVTAPDFEPVPETTAEPEPELTSEPPPPSWELPASSGQSEFQALFFSVNGVTFAVSLTELGGIHQLGELSHLIGRPSWYMGLQSEQHRKLDVVDTARWVMPESIHNDDHRENYRYVVMLGESKWGLACDQLHGTETLTKHSVRWREKAGKRPWLAGMVKEKMCALIHVNELISMLKAGLDVNSIV